MEKRQMTDDKLRILKMLENGTINASEAAELLNAIQNEPSDKANAELMSVDTAEGEQKRAKWMRIQVTNTKTDKKMVNIRVPLALIRWAGKSQMLKTINIGDGKKLDLDDDLINQALNNGEPGIFVDVEDEDDGEHVIISLE